MLLFLSLFFSLSLFASDLEELSYSTKWLRLLHYKKTLTGNYQSQADGKDFFLHPEGKDNPLEELKYSIELFSRKMNPVDGDPACKFPARLKWLNHSLGNPWNIDFSRCEKYLSFFTKLAARRASIIFSSYYLGNPNSAFGHTFIRLSRYDDREETEMLDYGINYAAEARASNPFSYAIKGLFGGFVGKFTAIPYYYKIREYSDAEFRDLWSYELKLNMKQVLEMVDHVWELGRTHFDYYYFHENCSYHLLSVIEAVAPEYDLTSNYSVFTIPADTVRLLKEKNLISEGKRRESTYSRLMRRSEGLSQESLNIAKHIALNPSEANDFLQTQDQDSAASILDVAIEAFDYYNSEEILSDKTETKQRKFPLLSARAQNPVITQDKKTDNRLHDSPALSHAPTRISFSGGHEKMHGSEVRLEYRAALHDLLDPLQGSLKGGELEMAKFALNYKQKEYGKSQLILESLSILNLKNYPEQNFWASPLSWEIELGMKQIDRMDCFDCPAPLFLSSFGNSLLLMEKKLLLALLFNGEINFQNYFQHGYRVGIGPKFVSRFNFTEKWMLGMSAFHHSNTFKLNKLLSNHEFHSEVELRYHFGTDFSFFSKFGVNEIDSSWRNRSEFGLRYFY
jgi:hypothetical protein